MGLDVFATGEHHNPPFVPSSPTTMLGHVAARTEKLVLSTATTLSDSVGDLGFRKSLSLAPPAGPGQFVVVEVLLERRR